LCVVYFRVTPTAFDVVFYGWITTDIRNFGIPETSLSEMYEYDHIIKTRNSLLVTGKGKKVQLPLYVTKSHAICTFLTENHAMKVYWVTPHILCPRY